MQTFYVSLTLPVYQNSHPELCLKIFVFQWTTQQLYL